MRLSQHINQVLQYSNLKVYIYFILPLQFRVGWYKSLAVTPKTHNKNTSVQLLLHYHKNNLHELLELLGLPKH